MASWVKCRAYTEEKDPIWVNLDHVLSIKEHQNGSVLVCAVADHKGALEYAVWDRPDEIFSGKRYA